ncbi:ShlB/FhaC/HecB family hemolysin secretion/activation protein [Yoonia sp. GPGPB17]|uniref:ShlB/FhaC/HecB family hemolysin secretion/activation protein n=1 Tax=Yoonia sp. GPGPB17 TaxID=3026147 RepID=UPI0030C6125D
MKLSIIGFAVVFPAVAFAQGQDAGQRLQESEEQRRALTALTQPTASQEISVPAVAGPVEETPCFDIDAIIVRDATIFAEEDFAPILTEFAGRCLGKTGINNLIGRISALYADAGYITTQAYVPEQDISQRKLVVTVLEGRVASFVYQRTNAAGEVQNAPPRKIASAMPLAPNDIFQLRDLEHGLEQMNRLPSVQADANLSAADIPGASVITVTERTNDWLRGVFGYDNRGADASGKEQLRFTLEADDLLNINDLWTFNYATSEETNAVSLSLSAPYRKWLFSSAFSYSEEDSPLNATSALFTQTLNSTLTAERLLSRNATTKHWGYLSLGTYRNERFVNLAPLTPQRRSAVRLGWRAEHRAPTYVLATDTRLSFGARFLNADWEDEPADETVPTSDFRVLRNQLTYLRPFESGRQMSLFLTTQVTDEPLFSNEQVGLGGWDTIRGYDNNGMNGDRGITLRSEFGFPARTVSLNSFGGTTDAQVRMFTFFDIGRVQDLANERAETLSSLGAGWSLQIGGVTLDSAIAVPLNEGAQDKNDTLQGFVRISTKLF